MIENGTLLQNRYLIEKQIGAGGMGAVYLAVDGRFDSFVAIKETFYKDDELGEAFEREARLLNGLHHPNLPHVSDYFTESDGHFLVMQFIEGEDLFEILKREEAFPQADILRWTNGLLDALDYLHSQEPPIIHRDIKPQNLKITVRGDIILLDFGLAKLNSDDTQAQLSVFGYSRKYSPLEQIQGTGTDARSDIFALGATIYHLLTGKPPIDVLARASAIVAGNPDPLKLASDINPEVPIAVAHVLNSALSLNAEARFVSANAMRLALKNAVDSNSPDAMAETPDEALIDEPVENGNVISHDTENFPALEAFAVSAAHSSPSIESSELDVKENSNFNVQPFSSEREIFPQSPTIVEEATRVIPVGSKKSRFSLAALLVLLSCVGLAAGFFFIKANSSTEANQIPATDPISASSPEIAESDSVAETDSVAESVNTEIFDMPLSDKTAPAKSTRIKNEQIAEKRENAAKQEKEEAPPVEVETTEKIKPVEKTQTSHSAARKTVRPSKPQSPDESRPRVVEESVPDIESIFTGRPSRETREKPRNQATRRQQREQMSDEELQDYRRRRREERRRRGNINNFPF